VFEQPGAGQHMGARVVHDVEIAGVVHVQVDVDVVGQDAQAQPVLVQNAQRRKRPQMLADGQRRNADKADEVRQGVLPRLPGGLASV